MPFLDLDGARIHWRADGAEHLPALLLGNSLGAELALWDSVVPALQQRFRVIRFDNRGHGASTVAGDAPADYSLALLAGDVLAVADAASAPRFHYCGLSIGGMVGMWLGIHAPQRLQSLVLSNTAATAPRGIWDERIAAVCAGGVASLVDATLQRWFTPAFATRCPEVVACTREAFLRVNAAGYLGCAAAIRDMELVDALVHIHTPTLVIAGRLDPATPPALGQEIARRIPAAQWVQLEAAHIAPLEQADAFATAVGSFLDRLA
jgi:3-oxoadipate enol-lactonase